MVDETTRKVCLFARKLVELNHKWQSCAWMFVRMQENATILGNRNEYTSKGLPDGSRLEGLGAVNLLGPPPPPTPLFQT